MSNDNDPDEFELMDSLQDDVEATVSEELPFEPDQELRDETPHEDVVEDEYDGTADPDDVDERDIELTIFDGMLDFETDINDGFDEL